MSKFAWGTVIDRFEYDFDGVKMEVTKYHPRDDKNAILFHCEQLSEATETLFELVIAFIARKNLGLNQHALVSGICRALELKGGES